ncbi:flavodoxin domain-containing protein [Terasakiella sp.]|uniref:flavodoxin domain-containing protein n=1 Tax=Terasakiella sp. TaxID=2034861 RepID=UPI003AA80035
MTSIAIFVGTESGNAQMVAEALNDELSRLDHDVEIIEDFDDGGDALNGHDTIIISCSTHGLGELPDNIIPLYDAMKEDTPDLSHVKYGIIALGDQTYSDTFCKAGKDMDAVFAACGAKRVGDRLEVDACTQPLPDEEAIEWVKEWLDLL